MTWIRLVRLSVLGLIFENSNVLFIIKLKQSKLFHHQTTAMRNAILLLLIFIFFENALNAQQNDPQANGKTELKKDKKNTIKFNVTNPLIFGGRSIIFGYERILKNNQSISLNVGQTGFPSLNLINSDSLKAKTILGEKGFHISADYRFYLSKQNKFAPPRGVYIGPYAAYNYFERTNSWIVKSTEGGPSQTVDSKTSLTISAVGFEMGYQFVFWDRLSLDMILLGPGVAFYNLKASIGSNLSESDKQKFFDNVNQALEEKFPGYNMIFDDGEFQNKGTAKTTGLGFRYMILIGYRF